MPQDKYSHLSPLSISSNWHKHNRSLSSLSATSDAATFHSALAHPNMEMFPLSSPRSTPKPPPTPIPTVQTEPESAPQPTSQKMSRQDSGYSETKPRTSISSTSTSTKSSRPAKPRRRTTTSSSSRHNSQVANTRPHPQSRHTTPSQAHQFFHFPVPSLPPSAPSPAEDVQPAIPPPPSTVHYWTSDSTRRLEYAAIDAASKGVRGFFVRLVPDCILPVEKRRTRFHGDGEEAGDACSVRRYRLVLPDEGEEGVEKGRKMSERPGILRRWTAGLGLRRGGEI